MATTRLRRTFAYPTESDPDDPPDLDEEHQEALLTTLQSQDEATSALYRNLFLALPVLTSLAYIPAFAWASGATEMLFALLNVVVPALAAWILWAYPIGGEREGKGALRGLGSGGVGDGSGKLPERYLIVIGASSAGVLILQSGILWWAVDSEVRAVVPAVVFFLTLFVRRQLAPVDLEELRKARYELKGA